MYRFIIDSSSMLGLGAHGPCPDPCTRNLRAQDRQLLIQSLRASGQQILVKSPRVALERQGHNAPVSPSPHDSAKRKPTLGSDQGVQNTKLQLVNQMAGGAQTKGTCHM